MRGHLQRGKADQQQVLYCTIYLCCSCLRLPSAHTAVTLSMLQKQMSSNYSCTPSSNIWKWNYNNYFDARVQALRTQSWRTGPVREKMGRWCLSIHKGDHHMTHVERLPGAACLGGFSSVEPLTDGAQHITRISTQRGAHIHCCEDVLSLFPDRTRPIQYRLELPAS